MCVCTELIYYYGVGAEVLCICLHTRSDGEPQARYLKQNVSKRIPLTPLKCLNRSSASTSSDRVNEGTASSLHVLAGCANSTSICVVAHLACQFVVRGVRNPTIMFSPHSLPMNISTQNGPALRIVTRRCNLQVVTNS